MHRAVVMLLLAAPTFAQDPQYTERERMLLERIEQLERRLAAVEARTGTPAPDPAPAQQAAAPADPPTPDSATTINFLLDGYYGYNFNRPIGRVNLLRAFDVTSNNFSINQAGLVLERAPDPAAGRRFGLRFDLQWGQATETLSGSFANEPRPQVWRHLFQAYGTYIAPLGRGLTFDFGKWASPIGIEGAYTKDQFNYSRSYAFDFLPFYHTGLRVAYNFSDRLTAGYWIVNGIGQAEDFNGNKSQNFTATWKPLKAATWTFNYYTGIEAADVVPIVNPGPPSLPTQAGLSTTVVRPAPDGRTHIIDSYGTVSLSPNTTLAAEADYFVRRLYATDAPAHVTIGALYLRRVLPRRWAVAARAEYLSDRGGAFSGVTQALKETTVTADYRAGEGFLVRWEWRRDFSNQRFFLTSTPGLLSKSQQTATMGVVWWAGRKEGAW